MNFQDEVLLTLLNRKKFEMSSVHCHREYDYLWKTFLSIVIIKRGRMYLYKVFDSNISLILCISDVIDILSDRLIQFLIKIYNYI